MSGASSPANQTPGSPSLLRAALGANPAAFIYLVGGKPKSFADACQRAFRAARDEPARSAYDIPTVTLDAILDGRRPQIQLTVAPYEDGMLPTDQLISLLSILVAEHPAEVLEIGTFMGHTTAQMADALPDAVIHTV